MNKYYRAFPASYNVAMMALKPIVKNKYRILDIGSGDGSFIKKLLSFKSNNKIDCIDIEKSSIKTHNINFIQIDANQFLRNCTEMYDMIIMNASLHEVWNTNKINYLSRLLKLLKGILNDDGIVFIGDFYYAQHVPSDKIDVYRKKLIAIQGHADKRNRFMLPEVIIRKLNTFKEFRLIQFNELKATEEIERYYYYLIFRKVGQHV